MSKSRGRGRSARQYGREELARKMREWAVVEMGLSEQGDAMPSHGELQVLIKGNSSNPWEHVVAHVRTPRTAELVRKNIRLHSSVDRSGGGMEEGQLHVQRAQLAQELSSLRLAVAQLEMDAGRLQSDIHQRVADNSKTKAALSELSQKSVLLSANSVKCKETVRVLNEFSRRIRQRVEIFRHLPGEASYFTRSSAASLPDPSGGSKPVVLESACTREVRKACNQVEEVVGLLSTQEGGQRSEQLERAQEQAWNKTEALLCHHPPCDIVTSLTEVTQDEGGEIRQHTAAIDLKRDAEQLKYKVEPSGGMRDVAEKPNLLHSVEEHLLEAQLSHVRRSVESERAERAATEVQQRLLGVKGHLEQLLSMQYGSDAEGLDLARTHLWLELEEAGGRAAVRTLSSLCASLSFSRDQRRTAIEHLHQKHKRITEFTQAAEVRQAQIGALVKLNSAARDRLQKQRTELELYVKESVCTHEAQLVSLADALQDGMWHEVQLFSTLSLARLTKPPGLSSPVCELSVSRLSPVQPSGAPSWEGVLRALGLPPHAAPEEVIPQLSSLFRRAEALRQEVLASEELLRKVKEGGVDRQKAEGTLAAVQQYDRQQMAEGIPALKQCLSQAEQSMAETTTVQKTMQEWWEQPALSLTPWLNYDGMDMQQWVRQWRVLTTKLRQLSAI